MGGDPDTEFARELPLLAADVDGVVLDPARSDAERQQARGSAELLALHACDVVERQRLVLTGIAGIAVGEARAAADLAMHGKLGVGISRREQIMRPVVNGGDAGRNRLGEREPHATRIVLRGEQRTEHAAEWEIAGLLFFACHVARDRAPHMPVRLDESRAGNHRLAVNDLCGRAHSRFVPTATIAPLRT